MGLNDQEILRFLNKESYQINMRMYVLPSSRFILFHSKFHIQKLPSAAISRMIRIPILDSEIASKRT